MIDNILIFVAGMILGGFVYVQIEGFIKNKIENLNLKRFGQIVSFASIFFISVNFLTFKAMILYGFFTGSLLFSFIPQMTDEQK
ncbi:hypothetical protein FHQ18_03080 [Deferribacter autotrophicus]|uniref:Uncharacterized protein n=1 Tax=Deferribacter autotrophicus TaxID=500465 RepID=A0A5A8F4I3_9BACT|nr:hypothetical protein [Deferribacter autotrophicus]KAA0258946.1 hypothetical protein FHQ18_03080 [Deferribacter autotrophicus]